MKILIVGSVASGKSTFAKELSKKLNINLFEIDSIVHDDVNKVKRDEGSQKEIIDNINKENSSWVIEGTLRKHLDYLLEYADKIIFLNIDFKIRKRRILKRFIKQKLKLEKSNYNPSIEMLKAMYKWNNDFEKEKDLFFKRINKYNEKLIILNNNKEIKNFKISN